MSEELTTQEVIELLGISRRTVQSYVKAGKLTVKKGSQGRNTFSRSEVECVKDAVNFTAHCEDGVQIDFTFDPKKQIILDREHYEGLLIRLAQSEVEARMVREQNQKLLEDLRFRDEKKPWWRRGWFGK